MSGAWPLAADRAAAGIHSATVNDLCGLFIIARIMQSLVHVCFPLTRTSACVRFGCFSVPPVSFLWLIALIFSCANPVT